MDPVPDHPLTLLSIVAHPSDEAFIMGGTLALYAQRGVKVYVLCGTRGEVGSVNPELLKGFNSIGELREWELQCAAKTLGVAGTYFLGFRDSGMPGSPDNAHPNAMASQDLDEVARKVLDHIQLLKPQVVITHDPIGGYKHPDHIMLQRATKRAFEMAVDPSFADSLPPFKPSKLYYQTMPKNMLRWAVRLAPLLGMDPHRFGRNRDIDLAVLVKDGDFPIHARIDCQGVRAISNEASACHASQGGGSNQRSILGILRRYYGGTESFMRAYPPAEKNLREEDLFEGVE